jgi:splicing suppressor protein 51
VPDALQTCYCSRECQKADWKTHKKSCASNAAGAANAQANAQANATASSPASTARSQRAKGLTVEIAKPFHRLNDKTWIHNRPENDVFKLLIDTCMEDNFNLEGDRTRDKRPVGLSRAGA